MLKYSALKFTAAAFAMLLLVDPASAQTYVGNQTLVGNQTFAGAPGRPTADQIISALRPTGTIQAGTRGIRPLTSGQAVAAPATEAGSAATLRKTSAPMPAKPPSLDLTVQFEFGSAELSADAARTLDELGRALISAQLSVYRFRIEGHTDTVGTSDFNKNLSDQRAAVVARYLEAKFGVASARLETVGLGDTALLVATPPQTPELRNRRVHVVNLGA